MPAGRHNPHTESPAPGQVACPLHAAPPPRRFLDEQCSEFPLLLPPPLPKSPAASAATRLWRWALALAWSLAFSPCAAAAEPPPEPGLAQWHHTAWSVREGAPAQIDALAQTPDGALWLATATGLVQFDGVRFERVDQVDGQRLLSSNIASLFAPTEGGLWVGFRFGGAAWLHEGRLRQYTPADGLPGGTVTSFAVDAQGSVWAATSRGVARRAGGRWLPAGEAEGYAGGSAHALLRDRGGTLWLVSDDGIYSRPPSGGRFERVAPGVGYAWLREAHDGSLWISDGARGLRPLLDPQGRPVARAARADLRQSGPFLFDRSGALWVSVPGGLGRVAGFDRGAPEARSLPMERTGTELSGDVALVLLEDRDGNVWTSTSGGLDRFRRNKLNRMPLPPHSLWFALAAADGQGVWAGSANRPLMFLGDQVAEQAGVQGRMTAALRDVQGEVWFAGEGGLWRGRGGRFDKVQVPADLAESPVQALVRDRSGALWASVARRGLYRWKDNQWAAVAPPQALAGQYPLTMALDAEGRLWQGYTDNRILLADPDAPGHSRPLGAPQGLRVGSVLALHAAGPRVWVGGEFGLAVWRGGSFQQVTGVGGEVFGGLSGMVETATGELWLNGGEGITRIPASEVAQTLAQPGRPVQFERFDHRDGLDGGAVQLRPVPSAVQAADGKLWFATNNSVVWVDPKALPRSATPPVVQVRALKVDGRSLDLPKAGLMLPVGTTGLELGYTAFSLTMPERVRFRYRLQGVDRTWQEAGPRREAFYTNLQPGRYEFRVLACNEDGVWSPQGALLQFEIEPAFYQTLWFALLCVPLAAALLGGLAWLRWRAMAARISERLQARMIERERIARELHDTLLQSVQGLILRFQSALARLPADEPARHSLEQALDSAETVLVEGRDRVADLRARHSDARHLAQALSDAAAQGVAGHGGPRFVLRQQGLPRALDPLVQDEVLQIAREALANAFAHAQAREVAAEITWHPRALGLSISDDGIGIPETVLRRGGRAGHWGLQGMRERAEGLQARLKLSCPPGGGTRLELRVPGSRAYRLASSAGRRGWAKIRWPWQPT